MQARAKQGRLRQLVGWILLILLFLPTPAMAIVDFIRILGFNADALARGGTTIAVGSDPSDMNINPALISTVKSKAFDSTLFFMFPDLDFKYNGSGDRQHKASDKDRFLVAPGVSFVYKSKNTPWSYGFTVAAPDATATDYTLQSKNFGPVNAFSEYIHLRSGPAVAYQISPQLALGMRLGIDYMTLDLRMPMGLANLDIGQCDGWGFSAALGVTYKPIENLTIGFYYESPTIMQDLKTRDEDAYMSMVSPVGLLHFSNLKATAEDVQAPQNFGIGLAFKPIPACRLSADLKFYDWDQKWEQLALEFTGSGAEQIKALNLPNKLTLPANINDQITFSLGLEYFLNEVYTFLIGYHYNDDAMEDNYLNPIIPAEAEHTFTCGLALRPVKNIKVSFALAHCIVDDPSANASHGYDQSVESQLGLPVRALNSELSASSTDYSSNAVQFSFSFYW